MKLTEITTVAPVHFSGNKSDMDHLSSKSPIDMEMYSKRKRLPGGSGLTWGKWNNAKEMQIYIFDPNMDKKLKDSPDELPLVGQLDLSKVGTAPYWEVSGIAVTPEYRGKKIGLSLYGIVLDILGETLGAGESQTPSGQKMWAYLKDIPGVKVYGLMWSNPQFFREKNLTEKGQELFAKELKTAKTKEDAIEAFFKSIGGDKFVEDARQYAIPVQVKGGKISSDYVHVYGSYAVKLVARKTS